MHPLTSLIASVKSGCLIDYDRDMSLVQLFTIINSQLQIASNFFFCHGVLFRLATANGVG